MKILSAILQCYYRRCQEPCQIRIRSFLLEIWRTNPGLA
jgi:hypothetical protein